MLAKQSLMSSKDDKDVKSLSGPMSMRFSQPVSFIDLAYMDRKSAVSSKRVFK